MYLWTGTTPNGLATANGADYGAPGSSFGPALTTGGTTGALALYNDNIGVTSDGCEVAPANSLTGKVAIVDRGGCDFTVKVLNAQKAGAVGAIIANNVAGNPFNAGGTSKQVKIPSVMVSQGDGAALKTLLGASAKLRKNLAPNLQIDGDLDTDILYHEYGHGLTWRMIGYMSGKLSGAIGEGASDTLAFLINGDDVIAEYSASNPIGIRRYPYQNYPFTYSAVTGTSVHNDGEIYAGAMWRVLQNYLAAGLTADDVLADWVDGMNYTPGAPAFEDMRDGMLQATAGSGRECLIWKGFAASGIGSGANGFLSKSNALVITESFALPANCQ
jgi:extracellular elastinolytic metalloproteinase